MHMKLQKQDTASPMTYIVCHLGVMIDHITLKSAVVLN